MKDELGERIKSQYENRTRYSLPRRTYSIIRLDQKCGHTYTKNLNKPFDQGYIEDLNDAVIAMLPDIQGAKFGYVQSDEVSILLTDFDDIQTDAWFDGNIQKIASVSASLITAEFNKLRMQRLYKVNSFNKESFWNFVGFDSAYFDSRVFTIPDRTEVMNYLIWRNNDCYRNSISMVAQANFSPKQLHGKSSSEMQEMLFQEKNINWSEYPENLKNGRLIIKEQYELPGGPNCSGDIAIRNKWVSQPAWKFTQNKEKLLDLIPKYE